jgi:hypothetical protein
LLAYGIWNNLHEMSISAPFSINILHNSRFACLDEGESKNKNTTKKKKKKRRKLTLTLTVTTKRRRKKNYFAAATNGVTNLSEVNF